MPCPLCRDGPLRSHGETPVEICDECDQRAVNADGQTPWYGYPPEKQAEFDELPDLEPPDDGENPVFIDGHKCWRRYRFGGWITFLDYYDCDTIEEFYVRHGLMEPHEINQQVLSSGDSADPDLHGRSDTDSPDTHREVPVIDSEATNSLNYTDDDRKKLLRFIRRTTDVGSEAASFDDEVKRIAEAIDDSSVAPVAIRYLVILADEGSEAALGALPVVASLYGTAEPKIQQWIMCYFTRLSESYPDALLPIIDTLIDGTAGDNTNVQLNALAALGSIVSEYPNAGAGLVDDLAELLAHEHQGIRMNAMGMLGDIAQEHEHHVVVHAATIADCLTDNAPGVRRNASITLVRCGEADPDAIRGQHTQLERALHDDQPEVRKNACVLIGNAKPNIDSEKVERLAAEDSDPEVRDMAQWAVAQIGS